MTFQNRAVLAVRTHVGIYINNNVVTTLSAEKQKIQMELWPMGVGYAGKNPKGEPFVGMIPYSNIQGIDLDPVVEDKTEKTRKGA